MQSLRGNRDRAVVADCDIILGRRRNRGTIEGGGGHHARADFESDALGRSNISQRCRVVALEGVVLCARFSVRVRINGGGGAVFLGDSFRALCPFLGIGRGCGVVNHAGAEFQDDFVAVDCAGRNRRAVRSICEFRRVECAGLNLDGVSRLCAVTCACRRRRDIEQRRSLVDGVGVKRNVRRDLERLGLLVISKTLAAVVDHEACLVRANERVSVSVGGAAVQRHGGRRMNRAFGDFQVGCDCHFVMIRFGSVFFFFGTLVTIGGGFEGRAFNQSAGVEDVYVVDCECRRYFAVDVHGRGDDGTGEFLGRPRSDRVAGSNSRGELNRMVAGCVKRELVGVSEVLERVGITEGCVFLRRPTFGICARAAELVRRQSAHVARVLGSVYAAAEHQRVLVVVFAAEADCLSGFQAGRVDDVAAYRDMVRSDLDVETFTGVNAVVLGAVEVEGEAGGLERRGALERNLVSSRVVVSELAFAVVDVTRCACRALALVNVSVVAPRQSRHRAVVVCFRQSGALNQLISRARRIVIQNLDVLTRSVFGGVEARVSNERNVVTVVDIEEVGQNGCCVCSQCKRAYQSEVVRRLRVGEFAAVVAGQETVLLCARELVTVRVAAAVGCNRRDGSE